jgi:hypothetical protein
MRTFNYAWLRDRKWNTDLLGLIAAIYKEAGKQELFFKQQPTRKLKIPGQALAAFSDAGRAAHLRSMDGGTRARHKPRFRSTVPFMLTSFIPRAPGQKLKVRFLAGTRDQSMLSHP